MSVARQMVGWSGADGFQLYDNSGTSVCLCEELRANDARNPLFSSDKRDGLRPSSGLKATLLSLFEGTRHLVLLLLTELCLLDILNMGNVFVSEPPGTTSTSLCVSPPSLHTKKQ